ncbi:MAG: ATP-binding protein [Eubacteriales bacterium]|jgi:DNA replication protein DnaC
MAYDKQVVAAVNERFAQRREEAFSRLEQRRQEVYEKLPDMRRLDRELSLTTLTLAKEAVENHLSEERIAQLRRDNLVLQSRRMELLAQGGFPTDYLKLQFRCPACEDLGYIGTRMCDCYREELVREAYRHSVLANAVPEASFGAFRLDYYPDIPDGTGVAPRERMENNLRICREFAFQFPKQTRSLLLQGPTGLGKTFLSGCISRELVEQGVDVVYETAHGIFDTLERDKFSSNAETHAAAQRILDCELLIIDDLGTEFVTAFSVSALYNLINTRLLRKKKMIISTNCDMSQLEKLYSARIVSRLVGEFTLLQFCGQDIRFLKSMD